MGISFSLAIVHNDTVRHHALERALTRIGRDPTSDILIDDPTISRHQLTLELQPESVRVEMNPKSPNVMVRNGRPEMAEELHAGEFFYVGPYRFEIHASADLPQARRSLDEDPAGPIDLTQLQESERMAPRWRSAAVEAKSTDAIAGLTGTTEEAPGLSPSMRIALVIFLCLVVGYLTHDYWWPAPPQVTPAPVSFADRDLLKAVKPISCQSQGECLERAKDAHRIALELIQSSARDLVTLYKIAKLLHRAQLALGRDVEQIPGLKERYQLARANLQVSFADHIFFYQRALAENLTKEQKQLLQNVLPICREDRQPFCQSMEQAYQRFPD
jgi:hypothetical protein